MMYADRSDKSAEPQCYQCGNKAPEKGFVVKEVIHRGFNDRTRKQDVCKTKFTVCAGTPCGGHLQMGMEG
jgi:hypothetical protein